MPNDQPSETMWCMSSRSACSSWPSFSRPARNSGPRARSNGCLSLRIRRLRSASRTGLASMGSAERSTTGRCQEPAGEITWTGSPSTSANVVRSDSWRRTISAKAASRAGLSRAPRNRAGAGMLKAVPPGSIRSRSHRRCWPNDAGIAGIADPAADSARRGIFLPAVPGVSAEASAARFFFILITRSASFSGERSPARREKSSELMRFLLPAGRASRRPTGRRGPADTSEPFPSRTLITSLCGRGANPGRFRPKSGKSKLLISR